MTVWYVQYAKKILGPFDDTALKELAIKGKITPETLIRNGEKGKWSQSGNIKGLFDLAVPHNAPDLVMNQIADDNATISASTPSISSIPLDLLIPALPPARVKPKVEFSDVIPNRPTQKSTADASSNKMSLGSQRKGNRFQLLIVGAISSAVSLGVGSLAGVEHVKYSIRSKLEQMGIAFQQSMRDEPERRKVNDQNLTPKKDQAKGSDLESSRREWISITYGSTIAYKDERTWTDKDAKTGKLLFIMNYVGHTGEYVELFNSVRNDQLRLFPDHMEAKLENGWKWIGSGHWKK